MLQKSIGYHVFNNNVFASFRIFNFYPRSAINEFTTKALNGQFIAPFFKCTFGIFHDVAFVYQSHIWLIMINRKLNRFAHETLCTFFRYRFDPNTATFRETNFGHAHFFFKKLNYFFAFRRICFPFNPCIDIFRIFTKDHHIGLFGMLNGTRNSFKPANRSDTDIQIQFLTQSDIQ